MNNGDNIVGLIRVWFRWKKTILVLCLLAAMVSALASWLMLKNYYQSTTIFYAASSDVLKPDKLFGVSGETMYYYGSSEDVNRVLAVAESAQLRDYLTKQFGLYARYHFDSTSVKGRSDFQDFFNELYKVEKNKLDAVELSMEDTDPEFAQKIVLASRIYIDKEVCNLIRRNQLNMVSSFENSIRIQNAEIKALEDSLLVLRKQSGIYNTSTQSKMLTDLTGIAEARLARVSAQVKALEKEPAANRDTIIMMRSLVKGLQNELSYLKNSSTVSFNKGMGLIDVLSQMHEQKRKQMSYDAVRLEQIRAAQQSEVSSIYVVEDAVLPLKKSRPKRMIIVLASVLITFIFTTLGILLLERYRKIDWDAIRRMEN